MDGKATRAVGDESFIDERKPSSTMAAKGVLNYGPSPKKWMEMARLMNMMFISMKQ
jgi:hypothetical protein